MTIMQTLEPGTARPLASLRVASVRKPNIGRGHPVQSNPAWAGDAMDKFAELRGEEALAKLMHAHGGDKKRRRHLKFCERHKRILEACKEQWLRSTEVADILNLNRDSTRRDMLLLRESGYLESERRGFGTGRGAGVAPFYRRAGMK